MGADAYTANAGMDFRLLNDFQRDFPLVERPFLTLAEHLGSNEARVIADLNRLQTLGQISRIGPVFAPNRIGVSTLAALAVPEIHLERVAAWISAQPEVNHNYRREHHYNLWFVITAKDQIHLARVLARLSRETGFYALSLPLEREYHIDLGFDLGGGKGLGVGIWDSGQRGGQLAARGMEQAEESAVAGEKPMADLPPVDALVASLQGGLPLVARPFAQVAQTLALHESQVRQAIRRGLEQGWIKRFGVVVRHHELGWRANAMCVWDVPDHQVDALGQRLAREAGVTLCYRRRRGMSERAAGWNYNLFCMIHGRQREAVEARQAELSDGLGLAAFPQALLFSTRRYKQCGARYAPEIRHG